jgi:transposase
MRGPDTFTEGLFTIRRLDDFVPADHPLRRIRVMVNEALAKMDELFSRMYEADIKGGRPSIPPEKLLRATVVAFFNEVLETAENKDWLSGEHFSVDGTLIQAWAGHKSFVRKDRDDDTGSGGDFKGQRRSNDTHESKTDPDRSCTARARLPASCATWDTRSRITGTAWSSTPWSRRPTALPNEKRPRS